MIKTHLYSCSSLKLYLCGKLALHTKDWNFQISIKALNTIVWLSPQRNLPFTRILTIKQPPLQQKKKTKKPKKNPILINSLHNQKQSFILLSVHCPIKAWQLKIHMYRIEHGRKNIFHPPNYRKQKAQRPAIWFYYQHLDTSFTSFLNCWDHNWRS